MSVSQQTPLPTNKVTAGVVGGALTVVGDWILEATTHVTVPSYVAAAVATLFAFALGYFVKDDANVPL